MAKQPGQTQRRERMSTQAMIEMSHALALVAQSPYWLPQGGSDDAPARYDAFLRGVSGVPYARWSPKTCAAFKAACDALPVPTVAEIRAMIRRAGAEGA